MSMFAGPSIEDSIKVAKLAKSGMSLKDAALQVAIGSNSAPAGDDEELQIEIDQTVEKKIQEERDRKEAIHTAYLQAICNLARGSNQLTKEELCRTAAVIDIPVVSQQVWQERVGL